MDIYNIFVSYREDLKLKLHCYIIQINKCFDTEIQWYPFIDYSLNTSYLYNSLMFKSVTNDDIDKKDYIKYDTYTNSLQSNINISNDLIEKMINSKLLYNYLLTYNTLSLFNLNLED